MNDYIVAYPHTVNIVIYFLINLLRCGGNQGDTYMCALLIFQIRFSDSLRFI